MVNNRLNVKVENSTVKGGDYVIGVVEVIIGEAVPASKDITVEVELSGREKTTHAETVVHQPPPHTTTHVASASSLPPSTVGARPSGVAITTTTSTPPPHTHTQVLKDKNSFVHQSMQLHLPAPLSPGLYSLPFQFQMPGSIPPTCKGKNWDVSFKVKAKTSHRSFVSFGHSSAKNTQRLFSAGSIPGEIETHLKPFEVSNDKSFMFHSGRLFMTSRLDKGVLLQKNALPYTLIVDNKTSKEVDHFEVHLHRHIEIKTKHHVTHDNQIISTFKSKHPLKAQHKEEIKETLPISSDIIPTFKSKLIKTTYEVQFLLVPSGLHFSLETKLPLIVPPPFYFQGPPLSSSGPTPGLGGVHHSGSSSALPPSSFPPPPAGYDPHRSGPEVYPPGPAGGYYPPGPGAMYPPGPGAMYPPGPGGYGAPPPGTAASVAAGGVPPYGAGAPPGAPIPAGWISVFDASGVPCYMHVATNCISYTLPQ
eukprot:TRINITY_DN1401_c1_g2_i1.p1 TRINITY_DN1401_c1_g2~~TRINITY_DN1401_c1_g2_i1.p1  ORF type:complete len:477 (+),score=207.09 TRINITY_DN1401_c1_g2_i1:193-1623(+)